MSAIQIRPAARRDLDAILRIENASFGIDAWEAALFREYLKDCGELFIVAKVSGRIAGYSIACNGSRGAELDSIAVHPLHRGHGVARGLMKATLSALRRRGARVCFLTVRCANREAIALYARSGFRRVRRMPGYYADEDGWRMRKRLV